MSALVIHPDWMDANEERVVTACEALFDLVAAAGDHSIVTSVHDGEESSTAVDAHEGAITWVEHEPVILALAIKTVQGIPYPLIVRTFTDEVSHQSPNGMPIPFKVVRGWSFNGSTLVALTEAEMFAAMCTDADTGEPIAPEAGVRYADAWPVNLS